MRSLLALILTLVFVAGAVAQNPRGAASVREYPTAAAALEALRAKSGVKISTHAGWTVIEDKSTLSLWSFTPPRHPAGPAAIHRKVMQEAGSISIKTDVLCEAPKPACDALVVDFQKLNAKVRDDLKQ